MTQAVRNDGGLPRLYGYQQLKQIYGWGRRTLENAVRTGKLRRPMMIGKRACWYAADIDDYLTRLRGDLELLAVDSPDKIPDDKVGDAIQSLAARLASLHGHDIAPDDVVGITHRLTDEQRAAIAHNAAAEQRELIEGGLKRLEEMHSIEALLLVRSFLPQLTPFADACLRNLKLDINMTNEDWVETGWHLVDRVVNGETLTEEMRPREVVEALADDGVLSRKPAASTT